MKTLELIEELIDELENSPKVAFSKRRSVDYEIIMEIIEDIKSSLPDDVNHAKRILDEKSKVLLGAKEEADLIVSSASAKLSEQIEENEITQAAYVRAAEITDAAKRNAREIREGVLEYADEILHKLERSFKLQLRILKENRLELKPSASLGGKEGPSGKNVDENGADKGETNQQG